MIFDTHSSLSVYSFILSISVVLTRPITSPCNRFLSHFPWALTPCTRLLSPASSRYLLFLATLNWLEIDLFHNSESCSVVFASVWPHGLHSPCNAPGQNTKVGSLSLLQGIFPTQESNPGPPVPHCRRIILYQLSHQGSPRILEWTAYPFSSGSSQARDQTRVSCIAGGFFTYWAIREALIPEGRVNTISIYNNNSNFKLFKCLINSILWSNSKTTSQAKNLLRCSPPPQYPPQLGGASWVSCESFQMLIRGLHVSPVVLQLFFCLLSWLCSHWLVSDSFVTPRTVLCQAPLSMGLPRQEYWSGLPSLSPGDLPDSCITGGCFTAESPGTFQQFIFNTKVLVAQSCPTLCNHVNCGPPGPSVHEILQARILEWVALSSSTGSCSPRDGTQVSHVSCIGRQVLYH